MDELKSIAELEEEFRQAGSFLLVGADGKLRYYGRRGKSATIDRLTALLKGRYVEMTNFLIARARARGETT